MKSTKLDGDTANPALNCCLQPHMLKPDKAYNSTKNNVLLDGTFMLHVASCPVSDECNASDYSQDKHEESIMWKGALLPNKMKDFSSNRIPELDDYASDYEQEDIIKQKNDRIDWWATTWPKSGSEEDGILDCLSSSLADSDGQVRLCSTLWSDRGQCQPCELKVTRQRPVTNTAISSMGSTKYSFVDKEWASSCSNDIHGKQFYECSKNFMEFDLPLSQDNFDLFVWEGNVSDLGEPMPPSVQHTESSRDHVSDNDYKVLSCFSSSMMGDSAMREGFLGPSRSIIDTEDLDRLVNKAKGHKENMKKDMEEVYLLRQKVEREELVAEQAKAGAAHAVKGLLGKLEDIRHHTLQKRAQYEKQAADVYGEKSVLSMEARELRSRVLVTQAEQARAMSLLDSVRCTLAKRLQKATQAKDFAVEEAKVREESAKQLLAYEEDTARMLAKDMKALEIEAERCRKLREFLIQHGNVIDSLQGEVLVLCEDILNIKKQVDEGILLSDSRRLRWSQMSHLTQPSVSMISSIASINANNSRASNLTELSSGPSIRTLSSAMSGPPSNAGPVDYAVQSQYFSSDDVPVEALNEVNKDNENHSCSH